MTLVGCSGERALIILTRACQRSASAISPLLMRRRVLRSPLMIAVVVLTTERQSDFIHTGRWVVLVAWLRLSAGTRSRSLQISPITSPRQRCRLPRRRPSAKRVRGCACRAAGAAGQGQHAHVEGGDRGRVLDVPPLPDRQEQQQPPVPGLLGPGAVR